jgi:hypothetical protein
MILLFANNAVSTIASPITAVSVSVQVQAGDGVKFPNPIPGSQFFKLTFFDAATGGITEIVHCTQRVGDVMTIVRAQEGTIAQSWLSGDSAKNMPTAQTQANFIQVQQAQAGATNTAIDTGTANSYVAALTPSVTTRIFGLFVRIQASNANTGASTLNIGAGSFPIVNPDGSPLGAGAIVAGGFFEVVDDGATNYQLISASQESQSSAGVLTTGAMQFRPTSETIAGWVVANATTIGNAASNATQLASATAANLFAWHWNNFSNTQCPVFTSGGVPTTRGVNAATDFAANKQIQVYDKRGKGIVGIDTMQGGATTRLNGVPVTSGSLTTPGSVIGENLHALIVAELAQHNHGVTDPGHAHNFTALTEIPPSGAGITSGGVAATITSTTFSTAASATGISINNAGSGTAHNNVSLSDGVTFYLKL